MAEIIPFPSKPVRDWKFISETINKALIESGANKDMRDVVTERVKVLFDKINNGIEYNIKLPIPSGTTQVQIDDMKKAIEEGIMEGMKQIQEMVGKVLVDKMLSEIYLYRLEKEGKIEK